MLGPSAKYTEYKYGLHLSVVRRGMEESAFHFSCKLTDSKPISMTQGRGGGHRSVETEEASS